MRRLTKLFNIAITTTMVIFIFAGCGGASLNPKVEAAFEKQQEMYTQRNMFISTIGRYGQKFIETTNYGNGIVIPVNTKVRFKDINSQQMSFTYDGNLVMLRNIPKYSNTSMEQMIKRYFGPKKVNLSKFTKLEKDAINSGGVVESRIAKGMSKEAVLISRGYPPAHATPGIKENTWKFWEHKFNTSLIYFKNNKVVDIKR